MTRTASLAFATGLGLALVSTAQAQNYAPSVNYQSAQQEIALTGRSAFVASAPYVGRAAPSRGPAANSAPLGYQGAIPAGD